MVFIDKTQLQNKHILGLPKSRLFGDNAVPNNTKPGNGLPNVTEIALDDLSDYPIGHINGKAIFSSSIREDWQRVAGETESRLFAFNPNSTRFKMSNSPLSPRLELELELYSISCQISFLSESVPALIRDYARSGISTHNEDVAYGLETIMAELAQKATFLKENLPSAEARHE